MGPLPGGTPAVEGAGDFEDELGALRQLLRTGTLNLQVRLLDDGAMNGAAVAYRAGGAEGSGAIFVNADRLASGVGEEGWSSLLLGQVDHALRERLGLEQRGGLAPGEGSGAGQALTGAASDTASGGSVEGAGAPIEETDGVVGNYDLSGSRGGPAGDLLRASAAAASALLSDWASGEKFLPVLAQAFGAAGTEAGQWSSAAEALRSQLLGPGLGIEVQVLAGAQMNGALAAYAAAGPGGAAVIYVDGNWLLSGVAAEEVATTLLHETGHAIDHLLNGNADSAGEEGEHFAALLTGQMLPAESAASADNDFGTVSVNGQAIAVEMAVTAASITAISTDTGQSATDFITNDTTLTFSGTYTSGASGNNLYLWVDGVRIATIAASANKNNASWSYAYATALSDGAHSVVVNTSSTSVSTGVLNTKTVTVDTQGPAAPTVALATDSGSSGTDKITNVGTLSVGAIEAGATVQYSANGTTWSTTAPSLVQGANTVYVRQLDVAGNVSASTSFTFTYDSVAPTATIATATFSADTGSSATDLITKTASQTVKIGRAHV